MGNQEFVQGCGYCGKQIAKCDPGDLVVGRYGDCTGEVDNGCFPTDPPQNDIACGFCGTQNRTCNNSCRWVTTSCTGEQPLTAVRCVAGSTRNTNEGCSSPSTGRTHVCQDRSAGDQRCTWTAPPSNQCAALPSFLVAPAALEGTASRYIPLADQVNRLRPNYGCTTSGASLRSAVTEIRNPVASEITVSVYDTAGATDLVMASYTTVPPTPTATSNGCVVFNDTCSAITGANSCLKDLKIPASGRLWIVTSYYDSNDVPKPYDLTVKRTK
ncbi:hypothetical protein EON82_23160 [bacterium]|nr:MAG: hypothetical protein EON82_23160 [bacterium]